MQSQPRQFGPGKYDAIHRALLSGLLSNIAQKSDSYEYTGTRGTKLNIFPGSTLFKKNPPWLMAAELVETTRLYARTVARIQPEWVERLADHLVKRTYFDPHWNPRTAHVVAYEKVSLYGLLLVPQRPVHYGPIDPVASRTLFIRALVEGEYAPSAPFYRHNQRLIDEIESLEAKSRNRDLLVSAQVRFDFYDARIPAGIHNGPLFERWRREAERHDPRILFMSRRDLMLHAGSGITAELFPDALVVAGVNIPLEYHLEPGHPADGVTATIPLAALTQIPAERFEWLVPGLLKEKITALIKSLPKNLRVHFVPAPDFAESAFATLKPGDGSLLDALALFLGRQKGIPVPPEAFDPTTLLDHLHMNFQVLDEAGKPLAAGRDLTAIRKQLGLQVRASFENVEHPQFNRERVTEWDFGDLPESVAVKRHGMTLSGYPALVDNGDSVSLRLLDSPEAAKTAHAAGLRRLLLIDLRDEIDYLTRMLPDMQRLAMYYSTLGPASALRADLVGKTLSKAFLYDASVRTAMEFELRKAAGRRHRLLEVGKTVAAQADQVLTAYHQLALQLAKPTIPAFTDAIKDIREQLAHLLPPGFLTNTPDEWLAHIPRYLKGMLLRLQKLTTVGHTKDAQRLAEVQPFWQAWLQRSRLNREQNLRDPALDLFRWMIEEFRISLFAQELKTSIPVSAKRLEKQWDLVRKP